MDFECIIYPNYNHNACQLNNYEQTVFSYFEGQRMKVLRLCTIKDGSKTPDFVITDEKGFRFLCEVKQLKSSKGYLTQEDLRRGKLASLEKIIKEAKRLKNMLVVLSEELKIARGEIPLPDRKRNTDLLEIENAKKIRTLLLSSPVADLPLSVRIFRGDPLHWSEEEIQSFTDYLIAQLISINKNVIPRNWHEDYGIITGHYAKSIGSIWYIHNNIQVRREGPKLKVDTYFYLGVNWEAVEGNCRSAQQQIRSRLSFEKEPLNIGRLIIIFIDMDLLFMYTPRMEELINEIDRRIINKFHEISAVAFCKNISHISSSKMQFLVFHRHNENIPNIPRSIFNDGYSIQFPTI